MATPNRHRLMTYDALVALHSTQDHDRTELIEGEPIVSPSPTRQHQETAGRLYVVILKALVVQPIGNVYFAPVDVRFSPTTVLQPDLLVLRTEHLARYAPEGFVDGPPIWWLRSSRRSRALVTRRSSGRTMSGPVWPSTGLSIPSASVCRS